MKKKKKVRETKHCKWIMKKKISAKITYTIQNQPGQQDGGKLNEL